MFVCCLLLLSPIVVISIGQARHMTLISTHHVKGTPILAGDVKLCNGSLVVMFANLVKEFKDSIPIDRYADGLRICLKLRECKIVPTTVLSYPSLGVPK